MNGLTAKWMTDPKLWELPQDLKSLMDMCSNLDWFICTPSRFLLMMTFSNTLMFSSHHLTFGMLLFWTIVLPLNFLMKSNQEADDSLLQDSIFDEFGDFNDKWYSTWMCSAIQAQQRLGSILFMHTFMKATLMNKTVNN